MRHGTCKHWSVAPGGVYKCAQGHDIRELVGGERHGWIRRQPCHDPSVRNMALPPIDPVSCGDYEEPTDAEVRASEAETMRMLTAFADGRCPTCNGPLVDRGRLRVCPDCPDVMMRTCGGGE